MAQARTGSRGGNGEARIGGGTRIRGRVSGEGDLVIEGEVDGDIAVAGALSISSSGKVTSDVEAKEATIAGTLEGSVTASGPVRVVAGSHVRGSLKGSTVSIEEGAEFAGRLECEFELPAALGRDGRDARK
jgi:cytoskeletal protein CcmA (bactofilin family)